MKRLIPFLLLLAALSCQDSLFPGTPRFARMQNRYNYLSPDGTSKQEEEDSDDPSSDENHPARKPVVYVTGLRFRDGAPWRDGDRADARIVLWKDGEEVLEIPAGHYPEPDRHRVRKGHLWSEDSDGAITKVFRDGEEVLRFQGDEILRGLLVVNGELHTLGQRAGQGGFSYRIDGEEVYSHPSGKVLGSFDDSDWEGGALMLDGGQVYYSVALPVRKGNASAWEYRVMQGDRTVQTVPEGLVKTVFDIRVRNGTVYRAELRGSDSRSLVLAQDDSTFSMRIGLNETAHLCRLVPQGEQMLMKGYSTGKGAAYSYWLRGKNGIVQQLDSDLAIADLYPDNPSQIAVYLQGRQVEKIWGGDSFLSLPSTPYLLYTQSCTALKNGVLYAALSSASGTSHLLLTGEEFTTLSFNGCLTSVRIE